MLVRTLVLFVVTLLSSTSVFAASLLSDSFSYSDGPLVTVSGGKWTTHSGTTGEVAVASGRLFLTQSATEDVNAVLTASSADVFYASVKLNVTNLPTSGISYFAHFKDSGTANFRGRLFVTTNGAAPGFFRVGVGNAVSTSVNTNIASDLNLNTDYTVVIRYRATNATTTLWLNPASESDPGVTASDSATVISVLAFAFRQNTSIGKLFVDDVAVGTSFSDVAGVPVSPSITTQPQSQTVTEGTTVPFTVSANGTGTLSYQWFFNGSNLSGATASALTLTNVSSGQAGSYLVTVSNSVGSVTSQPAVLTVNPLIITTNLGGFSLLHYNVKGNGATNWSTNSLQVQAIGRQLMYLNPDFIEFNEIPYDYTYEMTNFVKAYLPGYSLATNSGTDNYIRSVFASRYPITRSKSWLDGANLDPFGYTNSNFTRDLFEVQIAMPNFEQPLHLFSTHLKSSSSGYVDAAAKRAAEASAISNYFVTGFLTTNASHPYILSGDMNESDTNTLAIQRLLNPQMDLHLTNPTNPATGSIYTYDSASPNERIDFIFPCGLLYTNIFSSQVFRSSKVSPLPPNLLAGDSVTASDHLPVLMTFNNPYNRPFQVQSLTLNNQQLTMSWQSGSNRQYRVEGSTNFTNWTAVSGNILANGANSVFATNVSESLKFFRVYRTP